MIYKFLGIILMLIGYLGAIFTLCYHGIGKLNMQYSFFLISLGLVVSIIGIGFFENDLKRKVKG